LAGTSLFLLLSGATVIAMPDVIDKTLPEAEVILIEHNLRKGTITEVNSETIEAGRIVSTSVNPNEQVAVGTLINLEVSKGKEFKPENYVGQHIDRVRLQLNELGVRYKIEEKEPDNNNQEDGLIVDQMPGAGQPFNKAEDTLTLVVIRRKNFPLLDLSGYSEGAARAYATENGLELAIEYEYSDGVPNGIVMYIVDYYPNKSVKRGDTIRIVVSRGINIDPPSDLFSLFGKQQLWVDKLRPKQ